MKQGQREGDQMWSHLSHRKDLEFTPSVMGSHWSSLHKIITCEDCCII